MLGDGFDCHTEEFVLVPFRFDINVTISVLNFLKESLSRNEKVSAARKKCTVDSMSLPYLHKGFKVS